MADKSKALYNTEPGFLDSRPGLRLLFRIAAGGVVGAGVGAGLGAGGSAQIAHDLNKRKGLPFGKIDKSDAAVNGAKLGAILGVLPGMAGGVLTDVVQERQRTQDLLRNR